MIRVDLLLLHALWLLVLTHCGTTVICITLLITSTHPFLGTTGILPGSMRGNSERDGKLDMAELHNMYIVVEFHWCICEDDGLR